MPEEEEDYQTNMGYLESNAFLESARQRGVPLIPEPDDRVVITGAQMITPFGDGEQTWQAIIGNKSAARLMPNIANYYTSVAAPLPDGYNPVKLAGVKRTTRLAAMSILMSRAAGIEAGLFNPGGTLNTDLLHPQRMGVWVGSGVTTSDLLIDAYNLLHKKVIKRGKTTQTIVTVDEDITSIPTTTRGRERQQALIERLRQNSRRISLELALGPFPEEVTGDTAKVIGAQGLSGDTAEACATGASNIVQAYESIRRGHNFAVITGGLEDVLYNHPEVMFALFASGVRALSQRVDAPEKASRPFDRDRDGFVPGTGGAILLLESERFARRRGAEILAEVVAANKAVDGDDKTRLNPRRVADLIGVTLYDPKVNRLKRPDVVFDHATSTDVGDMLTAEALHLALGEDLKNIPVTALKAYFGHLFGGAGSVNAALAVRALQENTVPAILNLENPDPAILDKHPLNLVQGDHLHTQLDSILTTAYGFGGFNAVIHIGRYVP